MKNLLLIYNPTAGKMQIGNNLNKIIDYYTKQNYIVTVYPTQAREDGYAFVKEYVQQYDLIVCAGGDGTLNEIVSSVLVADADKPIGYIPCGSTNDFARSVGIPAAIDEAMVVPCEGTAVVVDIGQFNDKHFVYVAGFGLFTNVSYATPQKMKNSLGYLAYVLEGIKALTDMMDGQIARKYNIKLILAN